MIARCQLCTSCASSSTRTASGESARCLPRWQPGVPDSRRQAVAAELGFSETVFVDDRASGQLRIYTPAVELPFAGHPTVGAAWLLAREESSLESLRLPAGNVGVRHAEDATFIAARADWAPPFEYRQLNSPAEVRAIAASGQTSNAYIWSWIDEPAGTIPARSFAPELELPRTRQPAPRPSAFALGSTVQSPCTKGMALSSFVGQRGTATSRWAARLPSIEGVSTRSTAQVETGWPASTIGEVAGDLEDVLVSSASTGPTAPPTSCSSGCAASARSTGPRTCTEFPEAAGFWSVTTADDVHAVSRDWQTYSSERGGIIAVTARSSRSS